VIVPEDAAVELSVHREWTMCDSDSGGPRNPSLLVSLTLSIATYPLLTLSDCVYGIYGDFIDGHPDLWDIPSDCRKDFDEETVSANQIIDDLVGTSWRVSFLRTDGLDDSWSLAGRSINLRRDITEKGDLLDRTGAALNPLKDLGLDVITFFHALSSHDANIRSDNTLAHEWAFPLRHPYLTSSPPSTLIVLDAVMERSALTTTCAVSAVDMTRCKVNKEMAALKPIMHIACRRAFA
jgi:hypothetical protein